MRDPRADYIRKVSRRLRCSRAEKARLLKGLREEMNDVLSDADGASPAEIAARIGAPEDVAAELQAGLPEGEVERCLKSRQRMAGCLLAASVVVIILLVGYLMWLASIEVRFINSVIIYH